MEETLIAILLWFIQGLLCAWLAKRSGRENRVEWFALGVIFGPLALAVIIFKIIVLDK